MCVIIFELFFFLIIIIVECPTLNLKINVDLN